GEDVTILAWGAMVPVAEKTAEAWEKDGVSCEVIDLRSLYPIDEDAIIESGKKTGRAVIVHEAPRTAGVGAELTALSNERAVVWLEARVTRVTGYDVPVPYFALEDAFGPDVRRVSEAVKQVISG